MRNCRGGSGVGWMGYDQTYNKGRKLFVLNEMIWINKCGSN